MISRYDAYIDGTGLGEVNPCILVEDIQYTPVSFADSTQRVYGRQGIMLTARRIETNSVTISFSINERNPMKRQTILQSVNAWAQGEFLTTSDRPDQRLRVKVDSYASIESAKNWTEPLSIKFSAYSLPYWESATPTTLSLSGVSGEGDIFVPGTAESFVECSVRANAAITSLSLTVNGKTITLSGISIPANGVVNLAYDKNAILSIKYGSVSLLDKRTSSSADDLIAACGKTNHVSFSASGNVDVTFSVRGCWV